MRNPVVGSQLYDPLETFNGIRAPTLAEQRVAQLPMSLGNLRKHCDDLPQLFFCLFELSLSHECSPQETTNLRIAGIIR